MAGWRTRFGGWQDVGAHAPESCASVDNCFLSKRNGSVTLGAGGTLSPLPQRTSNGVPHALATSGGSTNASFDQLFGGTDRIGSRLRVRSCFQPSFQA